MSPLRQPPQLIAPESRRLLREARRMKKEGFGRAAEELAMASSGQKSLEPTIGSSEERTFTSQLMPQLEEAKIQAQSLAGKEALQGKIGFASSLEERAKTLKPGENLYEKAMTEAPKFGVNPAQLTNFFKKKNLGFGTK